MVELSLHRQQHGPPSVGQQQPVLQHPLLHHLNPHRLHLLAGRGAGRSSLLRLLQNQIAGNESTNISVGKPNEARNPSLKMSLVAVPISNSKIETMIRPLGLFNRRLKCRGKAIATLRSVSFALKILQLKKFPIPSIWSCPWAEFQISETDHLNYFPPQSPHCEVDHPWITDEQRWFFSMFQVPRLSLCSSPPSYDTVAKIDKVELPTYQQACQYYPAKV